MKWSNDSRGTVTPTVVHQGGVSRDARMNRMYVALVDLDLMRIMSWLTEPLPSTQWDEGPFLGADLHPDDAQSAIDAVVEVLAGRVSSVLVNEVRLLANSGDWLVVDMVLDAGPMTDQPNRAGVLCLLPTHVPEPPSAS